jgi:hypothetical protein
MHNPLLNGSSILPILPVDTHSNPTLYIHFDPDIYHTVGFHPAPSLPDEGPLNDPTDACLVSKTRNKKD